ncbi:CAAX protease family protein [Helicobacter sp. 13S00477-4]|nr:CAAX protease family protein [Helicobacter sp. 13S00477-4]
MWFILATSLGFLSSKKMLAITLLFISIVLGIFEGVLTPIALACLLTIACIGFLHQYSNTTLRIPTEILLFISTILLVLHFLPGIENLRILDKVTIGPHSTPYTMYFNFDKALIPFILFMIVPTLFNAGTSKKQVWWHWILLVISVPLLLLIAMAIGGLKIEPHFPNWLWQFALANLFFVSLAEEALFRGYIQQRLSKITGNLIALFITAILFGMMHYSGGYLLVIFAILAGLIYGIAWMWSGKLWISTLFHFGFNLTHLLFFTYPMYRA